MKIKRKSTRTISPNSYFIAIGEVLPLLWSMGPILIT